MCFSFTYLFSFHFYLYSDLDSSFHVDNAKANHPCASANRGVLHRGRIHSSHTASTNSENEYTDDDEYGDGESGPAIQSARSDDSGRTVLYPDLYVLTNDEHWTVTPETHKYAAAAAGSFCFVSTEKREQQDICNLTTMPCVQRSLCLDEVTNDSSRTPVEVTKGVDSQTRHKLERCVAACEKAERAWATRISRARKEASAQEVRGYYKQFAAAKHLEYKSWVDTEVFDEKICDRTMGAHHQD